MKPRHSSDVAALDANFRAATVDGREVVWHDALAGGPFVLEGLPFRAGPRAPLRRLPGEHASPMVESEAGDSLMRHTAGACVRFRTASPWMRAASGLTWPSQVPFSSMCSTTFLSKAAAKR